MSYLWVCMQSIGVFCYESFFYALLIAFFYMFFYQFIKKDGWSETWRRWLHCLKTQKQFRGFLLIAIYVSLVLFRTVIGRSYRTGCFDAVWSDWGFFSGSSKEMTEAAQNAVLLLPFSFLLFYYFGDRLLQHKKVGAVIKNSGMICFAFSFGIEMTQGVLGFGSFQVSDLVYNTLGGVIGAWIWYRVIQRYHKKEPA